MSRLPSNSSVVSSLLDRLKNDDTVRGRTTAAQSLRELKQSVLHDLENLLNTRWRCASWPPMAELDKSLVNYGIPDFGGANLSGLPAREEFRKILERTIRHFETRLGEVNVRLIQKFDGVDRELKFQIDAVLLVEPAPEPVKFETALEPATAAFKVMRVDR